VTARRVLVRLGVLLALLAAACGGAPDASPPAASPQATAQPTYRVKLGGRPAGAGTAGARPAPTRTPMARPAPTSGTAATAVPAASATAGGSPTLTFNGQKAYEQARAQVDLGPRPTGSEAGWATGDYILERLKELGWDTEEQDFTYNGVKARNIIARAGQGPVVVVGAHYDTRPRADQDPVNPEAPILGANDGASGVAVLLELARVLDREALRAEVWLAFFDAEDRGRLEGWPFSVGAAYMAEHLDVKPEAVIVLDMVGDRNQQFYYEKNSDPALSKTLWDIADRLGYGDQFIPVPKWPIVDDHIPFIEQGIPAVDVIDFDYPPWHTTGDTLDKISADSLERVGRVVEAYLEETNFR
jgi:hypothetical protein